MDNLDRKDKWTTEIPTVEGWYWCVNNGWFIALIERNFDGKLIALLPGDTAEYDLDDMEAWKGPIPNTNEDNLYQLLRNA